MAGSQFWRLDSSGRSVNRGLGGWLDLEWPKTWRFLLAVVLLFVAVVQLGVAVNDLRTYASDFPTLLASVAWFVGAIVSALAAYALARGLPWWTQALLAAELIILVQAGYLIWVDLRSPHRDEPVFILAILAVLQAVIVLVPLMFRHGHLTARAWVAVLAAISALGITQFVVETQVLPNRTAPSLDVTAELEEVGRTGDMSWVRGRVTWKNNGRATASVLGALATVVASEPSNVATDAAFTVTHPYRVGSRMDEPRTAFDPSRLAIPTSGPPDTPSETALAMADSIDPVHYSSGVYESQLQPGDQHEIIWMEDLTIPQWFVLPGQSETREFTFRVARTTASSVELRVDAWFVTNLHHNGWRTCRTNVSLADERFLAALRDEQSVDPNICLWASLQPRNTVRSLLDDDPYVLIEYVFDREGYFGGLAAYFASGESVTASALDEVEKITRIRPVAGAAVVAALPLADTTLEGG